MFAVVDDDPAGLHVRIPAPDRLPLLGLDEALETAFSVTAAFETAGDKFQQITGNFDGAGLSFGPAQVNFGSATLTPGSSRQFLAADRAAPRRDRAVEELFPGSPGRVPRFREIMVETILRDYGGRAARAIAIAARPETRHCHRPPTLLLRALRSGRAARRSPFDKAWEAIAARVAAERPSDQFALVAIAVEERGRKALPQWQADAVSRRLGILNGVPHTVDRSPAREHSFLHAAGRPRHERRSAHRRQREPGAGARESRRGVGGYAAGVGPWSVGRKPWAVGRGRRISLSLSYDRLKYGAPQPHALALEGLMLALFVLALLVAQAPTGAQGIASSAGARVSIFKSHPRRCGLPSASSDRVPASRRRE